MNWPSTAALLENCKSFVDASRYEQVRTFKQWLLPTFQKAAARYICQELFSVMPLIVAVRSARDRAALGRIFRIIAELMHFSKCFNSILEVRKMHAIRSSFAG